MVVVDVRKPRTDFLTPSLRFVVQYAAQVTCGACAIVMLDLHSRKVALDKILCTCRFWKGLLAVWIGGSLGQPLAFLLAR